MAVCQRHVSRLTCHLRGQARSHSLTAFICQCRTALPFCGSWLACDGGVSEACQSADLPPSRASPLPQFDRVQTATTALLLLFCGSWLACEGGVSVTCQSADLPPSRASPLPQFDRVHLPVPHCFAFLWELACLRCRRLGVSGTPG